MTLGALALAAAGRHTGDALTRPGVPAVTYPEFGRAVREIAGGLAALGLGPGDRVAILAGTRPEWTLADFGAMCAGAIVVPIYHTSSTEECAYVLAHSEARIVIVEDAAQAAKVEAIRDQCPALEHVVVMDGRAEAAVTLGDVRARGAQGPADLCERRIAAVAPGDVATIVYTSGTTGPAKGCVVTHDNLLSVARMYEDQLELFATWPVIYLYLPLAHSLACVTEIVTIDVGGTLAFWGGDPKRIVDELADVRPTHFPSVPRVFEKIHTAVLDDVAEQRRRATGDLPASRCDRRPCRSAPARPPGHRPGRSRAAHARGPSRPLPRAPCSAIAWRSG